jgi:mono/diheme cytochrome c family protein
MGMCRRAGRRNLPTRFAEAGGFKQGRTLMRVEFSFRRLVAAATVLAVAVNAWAFPEFARQTKAACIGCHANPAGGALLTDAGKAFKADHTKVPTVSGPEYVGVNKCRMCHIKQHKAWLGTKHATAFKMLKSAPDTSVARMAAALEVRLEGKPADNDACVVCHVTGFKLPGGYPVADSSKTAAVANVTCEACHGPGAKHVAAPLAEKKKFINRGVTANMCTQCHTAATSPTFKFDEYKLRGVHPVPRASG